MTGNCDPSPQRAGVEWCRFESGQRLILYPPGLVKHPRGLFIPCPSRNASPCKYPGALHSAAGYEGTVRYNHNAAKGGLHMTNPRYANGNLRRKHRERLRAMGCECGICHGRFGPIHYDEPSDAQHPLSFVVDEIRPVSRWRQFGYPSARAAAEDWTNLQAAHYFCNAQKGNKTGQNSPKTGKKGAKPRRIPQVSDGEW